VREKPEKKKPEAAIEKTAKEKKPALLVD